MGFSKVLLAWALACLILIWEWIFATPYMMVATIAYFSMVTGLFLRGRPLIHAGWMSFAICLDLALVLILQIQRDAVQVAASFDLTPLQGLHVGSSTLATVLYFPIFYMGYRLKTKRAECSTQFRARHVVLGKTAFVLRTIGFLMMFTILDRVKKG